jgi:hypothetical protein
MARVENFHCDLCGSPVHGRGGVKLEASLLFIDGSSFLPEKSPRNKPVKEVCFFCLQKNFFDKTDEDDDEDEKSSSSNKRRTIGFQTSPEATPEVSKPEEEEEVIKDKPPLKNYDKF